MNLSVLGSRKGMLLTATIVAVAVATGGFLLWYHSEDQREARLVEDVARMPGVERVDASELHMTRDATASQTRDALARLDDGKVQVEVHQGRAYASYPGNPATADVMTALGAAELGTLDNVKLLELGPQPSGGTLALYARPLDDDPQAAVTGIRGVLDTLASQQLLGEVDLVVAEIGGGPRHDPVTLNHDALAHPTEVDATLALAADLAPEFRQLDSYGPRDTHLDLAVRTAADIRPTVQRLRKAMSAHSSQLRSVFLSVPCGDRRAQVRIDTDTGRATQESSVACPNVLDDVRRAWDPGSRTQD